MDHLFRIITFLNLYYLIIIIYLYLYHLIKFLNRFNLIIIHFIHDLLLFLSYFPQTKSIMYHLILIHYQFSIMNFHWYYVYPPQNILICQYLDLNLLNLFWKDHFNQIYYFINFIEIDCQIWYHLSQLINYQFLTIDCYHKHHLYFHYLLLSCFGSIFQHFNSFIISLECVPWTYM